ncbi:histidine phosphatase family protein [Variovorax gossypii]
MKVIFVRHGESTGNAGAAAADHSAMALTALGRAQAATLAHSWHARPDLIATSAFLRTRLTAEPTIARFPGVPVKVLPMEEFTYLEPSRWNGTLRIERVPHIEAFWRTADPTYRDGPGAESFEDFLGRVDQTLSMLQALTPQSLVYAFSHGQFMQAVRLVLSHPQWTARQVMASFWSFNAGNPICNGELLEVTRQGGVWRRPAP